MTDLSVTAANVLIGAGAVVEAGNAGGTIARGKAVYKAADGTILVTDPTSATVVARQAIGIALNDAAAGQPVDYMKMGGEITIGATMTAGVTYYLSGAVAGNICPLADVGASEYLSIVGIAKSTTLLKTVAGGYSGVLGA